MTEVLLSGRGLLESIRWHDDRLYVSDWSAGEVLTVDRSGRSEVVARVPSLPLCFDWLPDGRLVLVSSADGQLFRVEPDGTLTSHALLGEGLWNDITVDGRGNVFVNRVDFTGEPGAVHLVRDGESREVANGLAFPNGMTVIGDTLVVAESYGQRLTAFDIGPEGDLSGRRVWADLGNGTPDGVCADVEGAVWYADVPNRCCVRVAEGGEVLRKVALDRGGFDCVVGGTTLYVATAEFLGMTGDELVEPGSGQVLAVPVAVPGQSRIS
ncbi:SMP-30/gluconolactonase/LRE family protein [Actinophytocola sp.]|uniref:SMP-30/gluconolactonase/LRE family protein n=1 Tax=Actinophytocola sp. TaxID=1872138 RepID=UPI002ED5DF90